MKKTTTRKLPKRKPVKKRRVIRAEELIIVDVAGKERISLGVDQYGASVRLRDSNGNDQAVVRVADNGNVAEFSVCSPNEQSSARLAYSAIHHEVVYVECNWDGNRAFEAKASDRDTNVLIFDGENRKTLGAADADAIRCKSLTLCDDNDKDRLSVGVNDQGDVSFGMSDGGGHEMVNISVEKDGQTARIEVKTRENMAAFMAHVSSALHPGGDDGSAYVGVEFSNNLHGIDLHASEDGANFQFMEDHDVEEVFDYEQFQNISACSTTFASERDSYVRKPQSSPKKAKASDTLAASGQPSVMPKLLPVWVLLGMDDTWEFDIHYEPYHVVEVKDGTIFYRSKTSAEVHSIPVPDGIGCVLNPKTDEWWAGPAELVAKLDPVIDCYNRFEANILATFNYDLPGQTPVCEGKAVAP